MRIFIPNGRRHPEVTIQGAPDEARAAWASHLESIPDEDLPKMTSFSLSLGNEISTGFRFLDAPGIDDSETYRPWQNWKPGQPRVK